MATTAEKILGVLLTASVVTNGYFLVNGTGGDVIVTETSAACNNEKRYDSENPQEGGGVQIDDATAAALIDQWVAHPQAIQYATFSKKGVDSMFASNMEANCLRISCGLNDGETPTVTMIATVVKRDYYEVIYNPVGQLNIKSDNVCPSICD